MAISYLLPLNEKLDLQKAIKPDGIINIHSRDYHTDPPSNRTTVIDFYNSNDDQILHISMRQTEENAIVFNSLAAEAGPWGWGAEERAVLSTSFVPPDFNITVYDQGDRYQILFSNKTVHLYQKRMKGDIVKVSYGGQMAGMLSKTLVVSTFETLKDLAVGNPFWGQTVGI